jgi:hypothetical protein
VPKPTTEEELEDDGLDELTLDTGSSAFFVGGRVWTEWRVYARGVERTGCGERAHPM